MVCLTVSADARRVVCAEGGTTPGRTSEPPARHSSLEDKLFGTRYTTIGHATSSRADCSCDVRRDRVRAAIPDYS